MDKKIYEEITDQYFKKLEELCYKAHVNGNPVHDEVANDIADLLCACAMESINRGSAATRFPYEIAEQQACVSVESMDGEAQPDGVAKHYFWNMVAGFDDRGEAAKCKASFEAAHPDKVYALFANGIPTDYE